jgi:hypothetical protein
MRALVAVAFLSSLARADTSVTLKSSTFESTFDRFVRDLAARRGRRLIASWTVNLDREPDQELVAVLYDADGQHGDFIIEKRGRQRWDVRFYADGRSLPSASGELEPPSEEAYPGPHARRPHTILYRLGHHHGYEDMLLALRDGRVAVVYDETLDDITVSEKPSATDWDALVRRKQAHYRFIEPGNGADDYGGLALRSLD